MSSVWASEPSSRGLESTTIGLELAWLYAPPMPFAPRSKVGRSSWISILGYIGLLRARNSTLIKCKWRPVDTSWHCQAAVSCYVKRGVCAILTTVADLKKTKKKGDICIYTTTTHNRDMHIGMHHHARECGVYIKAT